MLGLQQIYILATTSVSHRNTIFDEYHPEADIRGVSLNSSCIF